MGLVKQSAARDRYGHLSLKMGSLFRLNRDFWRDHDAAYLSSLAPSRKAFGKTRLCRVARAPMHLLDSLIKMNDKLL
jgi:hypothetical protein